MSRERSAIERRSRLRRLAGLPICAAALWSPLVASAQAPSPPAAPDTTTEAAASEPLPFFVTLGVGYGPRIDGCSQCPAPLTTKSFTAHLSVGKYLVDKLAIGLDASAWRRGQPASSADSVTVESPQRLVGTVGNASVVLSYQRWHLFVRGGVGVAFARQDVQDAAEPTIARGWGVGYTAGGGATLPIAGPASLVFFANYNTGWYDLETPTAIIEQSASHGFIEAGFGLTIR